MTDHLRVDIWYSLQSDYCYFLLDRLLWLSRQGVNVHVRPVLGLVLRMPEATAHRSAMEQHYFSADTARTAAFLGLPYAPPDPSPISFTPGTWTAGKDQPHVAHLYRLFVGAVDAGQGLGFLDTIGRGLWNAAHPKWDQTTFLKDGMAALNLDQAEVLDAIDWTTAQTVLEANHNAMLAAGHWGVPLMTYKGEPFYGQDRFDQLLWRMGIDGPDRA